ncbi:MAG: ATP-dependent Clp protease adaptor ClpS [Candidatus Sumerlaeia bacterium]|nr:ATP-dependent Clp protease adaptor ClpS [Candidatus Sumerlaeia bacterium]
MPTTLPVAEPETQGQIETAREPAPRYHVILFDDDTHTYDYVIEMMVVLFAMSAEDGFRVAYEVDHIGQAIVMTVPHEEALEARQRIITYGADPRMPSSSGSMACMIERAAD